MTLCGILSIGAYVFIRCKKLNYNEVDGIIFLLLCCIGVIIGGPLLYAIVSLGNSINEIRNIPSINFFKAISIIFGGNIFYGGLLGSLTAAYIIIRIKPRFKSFVKVIVPGIPLFHLWGRIGCFLGGCCFGIPSEIGFVYTNNPIIEANNITRFPVQLLEALFNLILFFILHKLSIREKLKNKLIFVYLIAYAIGRFFIEFLRGDAYRGFFMFLSTSQIISILIILFSSIILVITSKKEVKKEELE